MHPQQGPGLSLHDLGEQGGSQTVTLLESEMPGHAHLFNSSNSEATVSIPSNNVSVSRSSGGLIYQTDTSSNLNQLHPGSILPEGSSLPHNNMQPFLTMYFCIALQGVFPPRS